ncbi:MAG: dapE 2 [Conexibacter sp.]|nr:dapE 2 [Conexibacter sp.]
MTDTAGQGTTTPTEEIVALARELLAIDTANPPGNELVAAEHMAAWFRAAGIEATVQSLGDGRGNVLARVAGSGDRPGLVFSGHLDTVPVGPQEWQHAPRAGIVEDGRIYGRGALDMKGSVAAMALTLRDLHVSGRVPAGDVLLALTAGEETDSCGARQLAESGLLDGAGSMIIGEPTGFDVGYAHRGALWVRAEASGLRGHSSKPDRETNAICRLLDWLHPLDELEALVAGTTDPVLGGASMSLNIVSAGDAPNVAPDLATATLDFRTVPGQRHDELLAALRARDPRVAIAVVRDAPPIFVEEDSALVRAAVDAVSAVRGEPARTRGLPYLTDASAFGDVLGIPAVIVGPGPESRAHTVDEFLEVEALVQANDIFRRIAEQLAF